MKTQISFLISWLVPAGLAQAWDAGVATQSPFSGTGLPLARLPISLSAALLVSEAWPWSGISGAVAICGASVLCLRATWSVT